MGDIVKLIIPFFSTPVNYDDVLKRLASFAFYEIYLITLILRTNHHVDDFLRTLEGWGPVGKVVDIIPHHEVLDPAGLVIAIGMASLGYMFQLHDRVSDIIGIRRRFDCKHILIPLAKRVGSQITKEKELKIAKHRDELMRAVFYRYASSRSDKPLVDKHDIEHALGAWCWFWSFVEAILYFSIGALMAWWSGSKELARAFGIAVAVFFAIASVQRPRLNRYARPQIDSIAHDEIASAFVKQQFDAL